ncbi:hypothetical protein WT01_30160 [Burkholderia cepacia]|nr:hypothetical protein WT01_30160 [Burkholderia cepacia]
MPARVRTAAATRPGAAGRQYSERDRRTPARNAGRSRQASRNHDGTRARQAAGGFPLQPIAAGRYHDAFERVDGAWRFAFRDYTLFDFARDLRCRLNDVPAG